MSGISAEASYVLCACVCKSRLDFVECCLCGFGRVCVHKMRACVYSGQGVIDLTSDASDDDSGGGEDAQDLVELYKTGVCVYVICVCVCTRMRNVCVFMRNVCVPW